MSISIVIADDQILFREALRTLLETQNDFEIAAEASNGLEAVKCVQDILPDIVLMDLRMPEMDGVQAIKIIHDINPQVHIIMLTTFDED